MRRSLSLWARRVRPSGCPPGLTGRRQPEGLPSPPPRGGSVGFIAGPRDAVPLRRPRRGEGVALLAVGVVQQRDACGAVGVVLDVGDLRRHAVLVGPAEVDDAVGTLVPAALVPRGDPTVDVASALAVQRP